MSYPFRPYSYGNIAAIGAAGSVAPSLPAFSNVVAVYGLNNFNPVGYPAGLAVETNGGNELVYGLAAPYSADWATFIAIGDPPPFLAQIWGDQNSNANDLTGAGSARPTLQIVSSVLVSGAGTSAANGEYRFLSIINGKAKYQKGSDPDAVINWTGDNWIIGVGGDPAYLSLDDTAFPWQAVFVVADVGDSPAPTVTQVGSGTGQVEFNGTATGLQSSIALYGSGSATGTIYGWIQPKSLSETGVIFETGTFADRANTIKQISIRMVAGVLTATIFDQTAITALPNMKVKTLSAIDPIFITFQWDTAVATASLQTTLLVNNSATGVSSAAAADLSGLLIGGAKVNVGARNNAASAFLTANMWMLLAKSVVDSSTVRAQWFAYQQYLKSLQ